MSILFDPITMRALTLPNRIVIAPMCQYSAVDGQATDWHIIHLGHLALSGAGLLIIEATGVEPRGRISEACLGLYSDDCEAALQRVLAKVRKFAQMPIGIQLGHAGRKASISIPGGKRGPVPLSEGGWETLGPSALGFAADWRAPKEMGAAEMQEVIEAFAASTKRADRLGLDLIEIHSAHGYLLSSFLSPLANRRDDRYGGVLENRMRFPLEVVRAVRASWPATKPLGVRFNGTDWIAGGIEIEEAVTFASVLAEEGCDYVDVSSGGNGHAQIPLAPGYQVPFAERVKKEVGIATMAVGLIRDPHHANTILESGRADMIAIGRGFLHNPRWPWHAAEALGAEVAYPRQYARGAKRAGVPNYDVLPVAG